MALPATIAFLSTPTFRPIRLFEGKCYQCPKPLRLRVHRATPLSCSVKLSIGEFGDLDNVKLQMDTVREKLQESVPQRVKEFPWRKAESLLLERLVSLAKKALKWSFLVFFIFSSVSDVIFSISRNQELMIPSGLFIGYLATDFFKETAQEVLRSSEEKSLKQYLVGMSCFLLVVKYLSKYFTIQSHVFLLHVANGGLMQVLWLWRSFLTEKGKGKGNEENTLEGKDAPLDGDNNVEVEAVV